MVTGGPQVLRSPADTELVGPQLVVRTSASDGEQLILPFSVNRVREVPTVESPNTTPFEHPFSARFAR